MGRLGVCDGAKKISGPFSDAEEDLETLEHELTSGEVTYSRMMKMDAEFLLASIKSGQVEKKSIHLLS
jgi:hypothetical protein